MEKKFIEKNMSYDGSQLRPLYAYETHKVIGDSVISWTGPCNITLDHMVDLEDKIVNSKICSDLMLHFIIEIFGPDLTAAVALQRLFASIVKDRILTETKEKFDLYRDGDDIYQKNSEKKLSISIASRSAVSLMIHFAVNVTNEGTPVPTLCLQELKVDPQVLAQKIMDDFTHEYHSIVAATKKVFPL